MKKKKDRSHAETLIFEAEEGVCFECGSKLQIVQHRKRFVETFEGVYLIISKDRACNDKACPQYRAVYYRPVEECELVLSGREFGFDVIIYIGEKHLQENKSIPEIHRLLTEEYQIDISERSVGNLLKAYLALCHCVHGDSSRLKKKLKKQGGITLEVDGVSFDDRSAILYIVRDATSGEVLYAQRSMLRRAEDLVKILKKVKQIGVPILGVISDKEKGLVPAIQEVFPDVPYQFCQYHYLGNLAKPLNEDLKKIAKEIRNQIKEFKEFRKELLKLQKRVSTEPKDTDPSLAEISIALEFCELIFVAAKSAGKPPLAPVALKRYQVLLKIRKTVRKCLQKPGGPWRLLKKIIKLLSFLDDLKPLQVRLRRCVNHIQKIAHILKTESNSPQVKRILRTFLNRLKKQRPKRGRKSAVSYFIDHIIALSERYWEGLFVCYDFPEIPACNNDLERDFGSTKRSLRKISGRSSTAGGLMESIGEFVFEARSLLKFVPDLSERMLQVSDEKFQEAMQHMKKLQEPARKRRSFQRSSDSYLDKLFIVWVDDNDGAESVVVNFSVPLSKKTQRHAVA